MTHRYRQNLGCLTIFLGLGALLGTIPGHAQILGPNLIYTSIQPCRLIDTRVIGGRISAGASRRFNIVGVQAAGSLASQGGDANGCPIPGFDVLNAPQVQAVALNMVAVSPMAAGDLVAWPTDQAPPSTAVVNYTSNTNIANMVIVPVRQDSQGNDITVGAQVGSTFLVVDVMGYFSDVSPAQGVATADLFLGRGAGNPLVSSGVFNTAFGVLALRDDTTGSSNTAVGTTAMVQMTTGSNNTAVGNDALSVVETGSSDIAIGAGAANTYHMGESDNIVIGNPGTAGESDVIRIGVNQTQAFIAGINGATSSGGTAVFVNSIGQLGTLTSSLRFKEDVEDMGAASADLMKLRPVTFHYKPAYDDGAHLLQYGLIAEEVAKVYPGLVQYDKDGQPLTVRYHFLNAMLLNETQKQRSKIEEQTAEIASLREQLQALAARLAKLEAGGTNRR